MKLRKGKTFGSHNILYTTEIMTLYPDFKNEKKNTSSKMHRVNSCKRFTLKAHNSQQKQSPDHYTERKQTL